MNNIYKKLKDSDKPSDFMRIRRPKEFSDSREINDSPLTKTILEYHLETITNRKQEYLFENFCFELAQREICPNLIPQSGPIGGGDSKRDTENYPVSKEISYHYFYAIPDKALKDNWAFAFSAKKNWSSKVDQDILKIIDSERKFNLIYFISNQNISDKKRSQKEDALKKKYNIEVRLLDRNWIIQKVFANKREELAIDKLNIELPKNLKKEVSPKDLEKQKNLEALKEKIKDTNNYLAREYVLVEDFIKASRIARSLELPRFETEGFLDQSISVAKDIGINNQIIRALYNKAWTIFWWYDDYLTCYKIYQELEEYILKSDSSEELELLGNILVPLYSYTLTNRINLNIEELNQKKENFFSSLKKLFDDKTRPNNSTKAKLIFYELGLFFNYNDDKTVKTNLKKIKSILENSYDLLYLDVLTTIEIFKELGGAFEKHKEYDELFDTICDLVKKREGEAKQGELYLNRAIQKYEIKEFSSALNLADRARQLFLKEESIDELISCSIICSTIYKKMGLLWAARKELLFILNHFSYTLFKVGTLDQRLLKCYSELIWTELLLGRVPQILICITHLKTIDINYNTVEDSKKFEKILSDQDGVLSLLLLKSKIWQLKSLNTLLPILKGLDLKYSEGALQFALGYSDDNESEIYPHILRQPAFYDLPLIPEHHLTQFIYYNTTILGCTFKIKFKNTVSSIEFVEDLLGTMEAFFSTTKFNSLFFNKSEIQIEVHENSFVKFPGEFIYDKLVEKILIKISDTLNTYQSKENQNKFVNFLLENIVQILIHTTFQHEDFRKSIFKLAEEGALSRSLSISPTYMFMNNIFSGLKRYQISDWTKGILLKDFELKREIEWYENADSELRKKSYDEWKYEKSEEISIHKNIKILDEIVVLKYWDKAIWNSIMYIVPEVIDQNIPPILGFVYKEIKWASAIFSDLIKKIGKEDKNDLIRISFIEDINKKDEYIIFFTTDLDNYFKMNKIELYKFVTPQRIQIFTKTNKELYDRFKESFNRNKSYQIIPVLNKDNKQSFGMGLAITKHKLSFIKAKDVQKGTEEYGILELFKKGKIG